MSYTPTILFPIHLNNSVKKNHIIFNNILKFHNLNYIISIIYLDDIYYRLVNSWSNTQENMNITTSFFNKKFINHNLFKIFPYTESEINQSMEWSNIYNNLKQEFSTVNLEDIRKLTNIKYIDSECYMVDNISFNNKFLENQISRIEYEYIT